MIQLLLFSFIILEGNSNILSDVFNGCYANNDRGYIPCPLHKGRVCQSSIYYQDIFSRDKFIEHTCDSEWECPQEERFGKKPCEVFTNEKNITKIMCCCTTGMCNQVLNDVFKAIKSFDGKGCLSIKKLSINDGKVHLFNDIIVSGSVKSAQCYISWKAETNTFGRRIKDDLEMGAGCPSERNTDRTVLCCSQTDCINHFLHLFIKKNIPHLLHLKKIDYKTYLLMEHKYPTVLNEKSRRGEETYELKIIKRLLLCVPILHALSVVGLYYIRKIRKAVIVNKAESESDSDDAWSVGSTAESFSNISPSSYLM